MTTTPTAKTGREPAHLSLDVIIRADVQTVWDAITDWESQGRWMLGTDVMGTKDAGRGVGGELQAYTGAGPVGFLDTMVITAWEPPYRCDVLHTGSVVKGTGTFEVVALLPDRDGSPRSRFVWIEDLEIPLGALGRAGFPLVRPVFEAGVKASLKKFARLVEVGVLPRPQS